MKRFRRLLSYTCAFALVLAVGAISIVAVGWCLRVTVLADYSSVPRILLLGILCTSLYLAIVSGLFGLAQPIKVASSVAQDLLKRRK